VKLVESGYKRTCAPALEIRCLFGMRLEAFSIYSQQSRYHVSMKPLPAPPVPGNTEAERFDNAIRKSFTVSKQEMQRREAEWKRTQATIKESKKP
jgi:hypothetical protein